MLTGRGTLPLPTDDSAGGDNVSGTRAEEEREEGTPKVIQMTREMITHLPQKRERTDTANFPGALHDSYKEEKLVPYPTHTVAARYQEADTNLSINGPPEGPVTQAHWS